MKSFFKILILLIILSSIVVYAKPCNDHDEECLNLQMSQYLKESLIQKRKLEKISEKYRKMCSNELDKLPELEFAFEEELNSVFEITEQNREHALYPSTDADYYDFLPIRVILVKNSVFLYKKVIVAYEDAIKNKIPASKFVGTVGMLVEKYGDIR